MLKVVVASSESSTNVIIIFFALESQGFQGTPKRDDPETERKVWKDCT